MGFIDEYKWLEKLCGEMLGDTRGVTAYIEEMESTPHGVRYVRGWEDDLRQLKHYRWVRNKIVHDPGCSEENMCSYEDVQWIAEFHTRIMEQNDPLALYRRASRPSKSDAPSYEWEEERYPSVFGAPSRERRTSLYPFGCVGGVLAVVAVVAAVWLFFWIGAM